MRTPRRHISGAGIVVVGAVLAAIAVVLWVFLLVRNEESPLAPSPEVIASASSTPVSSSSPAMAIATPGPAVSIIPTVVPGSLPDLLRYAPDRLANDSLPLSDIARYADIDGWMASRRISTPTGPDDPGWAIWEEELDVLALPDVLHARANDAVWLETYGFQLVEVDQVLAVGQAPDFVLIMQGNFDPDVLQAAWVQSGYQAVRRQDYTIWSLFPGDTVDLSAPASRPSLGNLNNLILLEDGTLIATSRLSRMEETLRVVRGDAPSLDENPAVAALLAPGARSELLASAIITKGTMLATDPSTPAVLTSTPVVEPAGLNTPVSTPVPEVPMPVAGLMLAGINPPGTADAVAVLSMIVSYENADDATLAMIRVDRNLRQEQSPVTGLAYSDRMQLLGMRVMGTGEDEVVVLIRTRPLNGTVDWMTIISERDLGFLMWPWKP